MAQKAVLITRDNYKELTARYNPGEDREPLAVGYWLVAPFSSVDGDFDLLTRDNFRTKFMFTGEKLDNGFYGVKTR